MTPHPTCTCGKPTGGIGLSGWAGPSGFERTFIENEIERAVKRERKENLEVLENMKYIFERKVVSDGQGGITTHSWKDIYNEALRDAIELIRKRG